MQQNSGFTLVELLIVIVIIGVIAGIAVPRFASTKERAFDAAAQADIRTMMTAQEANFFGEQNYVASTVAAGGTADFDGDDVSDYSASAGVALESTAYTDGYQITASHESSSTTWCINTSPSEASDEVGRITDATSC